ncbi:ammonium transporter [Cymbomonas tetramitiformis]|uniref:Ammonium transporter n=1 Tax=Cymbomonas tetramitiformis TaxID=36881 RepID=A0AAE0FU09_9CHLO|nr:ammonium transporter [Cymbomonas tetramitiformis]KAK3265707.1 ammonium transporter [Cymbomonas tetramitiformis]
MSTRDDLILLESVFPGCDTLIQGNPLELSQQLQATKNVSKALVAILCRQFQVSRSQEEDMEKIRDSVDGAFVLASAALVFFMQAGFAMLCAGSVREKNCMNILLKNILDACVGAVVFYLVGFGFAYGTGSRTNSFIGNDDFWLQDITENHSWHLFFFQWAFAAATATIVSGSVAERCSFQAYILYSMFLTGFIYPVIVHWIWCGEGWLTAFATNGYGVDKASLLFSSGMIDFAGSGVVHMTGGLAGLMGATIIEPRSGRFNSDGSPNTNFHGHSMTLVVLGTFVLWFGWYGFNPGSQLGISTPLSLLIVGRTAVTTTLSGASSGVTALLLAKYKVGTWDLNVVCNGVLAGLVSITAGCSTVEPAAAILCGCIGAFVFDRACDLLLRWHIDDPLSAAPMHGFCGIWGVFFVGLMAKKQYVEQVYDRDRADDTPYGLFYGGGGELLACQIIGIVCIAVWTCGLIAPFFLSLKRMGLLRVKLCDESVGLDESHHGGKAYYQDDAPAGAVGVVSEVLPDARSQDTVLQSHSKLSEMLPGASC